MTHIERNKYGEPLQPVLLTEGEYTELIRLIDDEPVDEDMLRRLRGRLSSRRNRLRKKVRKLN